MNSMKNLDGRLIAEYFAPRFEEATKVGGRMIKAIQDGRRKQ